MANVYMRIDGLTTLKGAATLEDIGGNKGFMPIDGVNFGVGRSISMQVGAMTAGEMGTISFSDISISRNCDGASPFLQTFFFAPGDNGKKIEIVITKADRAGAGLVPSMIITLETARLSSYSLSGDGSAKESFTLAYSTISIAHYTEDEDGKLAKSDTVGFNLGTAKLTSQAKL